MSFFASIGKEGKTEREPDAESRSIVVMDLGCYGTMYSRGKAREREGKRERERERLVVSSIFV